MEDQKRERLRKRAGLVSKFAIVDSSTMGLCKDHLILSVRMGLTLASEVFQDT